MTNKPRGRRKVGQPADLDSMNVPGRGADLEDDALTGEGVALRALPDGRMTFWPVTFDRLPAQAREMAELVAEWVAERRELSQRIDATVPTLRELGMSWNQIAFLVGMTSEGVRQRWGETGD